MHKELVNPYEVPSPRSDWEAAAIINGFSFESSIAIFDDGSIETEVHLSAPVQPNDPAYLAALQINNLNATRPDGYDFSHALINDDYVHVYFSWTIPGNVV